MKTNIIKYTLYTICVVLGFLLYVPFRQQVIPMLTQASDIKSELESARSKLPAEDPDGNVIVRSLSYDEHYDVVFEVDFTATLFKDMNKEQRELAFQEKNINKSLCGNELVKLIFKNGGTVSANLHVLEYELNRHVVLKCEDPLSNIKSNNTMNK